jgi:hypothetical protein
VTDGDPREAVIARIATERILWRDLVAKVGEDRMNEPGPMGDWTFKDLASHLLGWRQRMIGRLEAAAEGRPEPATPWPAELDGVDEINPWIRARDLDRPLRDVLDVIDDSYARLAKEGEALAETELFGHLHDEHEASIRAWLADRD